MSATYVCVCVCGCVYTHTHTHVNIPMLSLSINERDFAFFKSIQWASEMCVRECVCMCVSERVSEWASERFCMYEAVCMCVCDVCNYIIAWYIVYSTIYCKYLVYLYICMYDMLIPDEIHVNIYSDSGVPDFIIRSYRALLKTPCRIDFLLRFTILLPSSVFPSPPPPRWFRAFLAACAAILHRKRGGDRTDRSPANEVWRLLHSSCFSNGNYSKRDRETGKQTDRRTAWNI